MVIKKVFFIFGIILIILVTSYFINNRVVNHEFSKAIEFKIDSIHITPALRCYLYDTNQVAFGLRSYTFFKRYDLKQGDLLVKKQDSKILRVYRWDKSGSQELYLELNPD